jgi:HTH-type transcriptional repressor of NAD biosynthesis genes
MNGFLLGKFLPPHAGHLHLVRSARARCDQLTVLVCTLEREPIPGALRAAWMRELCYDCNVVWVNDDLPQQPEDHPDFWNIWTGVVRRHCPSPEVVFSSEQYGFELARRLGLRHELIDLERNTFPVSGTAVRRDPHALWSFLPPPVRAHFATRIVLTGPESTGKSTMATLLAEHYQTRSVPEFARGYLDALRPLRQLDLICAEEDLVPIAAGQRVTEDEAARTCNKVLICDTDAIVTEVYSEHYFGRVHPIVASLAASGRTDHHLLFYPDVPWVDDQQRDRPHLREALFSQFEAALIRHKRPYTLIRGAWDDRRRAAIDAIDRVLATRTG